MKQCQKVNEIKFGDQGEPKGKYTLPCSRMVEIYVVAQTPIRDEQCQNFITMQSHGSIWARKF